MRVGKAFTLIEAVMVICLCSLITALVVTNISFLDSTIVRTEMNRLTAVCSYLQQLALATNKEYVLKFDEKNRTYSFNGSSEQLSQQVCFGLLPGIKGPPGNPQAVPSNVITFPHQKIFFYPTGIISSGTVYMIDKKRSFQYALSNAVSQVSCLRIYRHSGTWKLC